MINPFTNHIFNRWQMPCFSYDEFSSKNFSIIFFLIKFFCSFYLNNNFHTCFLVPFSIVSKKSSSDDSLDASELYAQSTFSANSDMVFFPSIFCFLLFTPYKKTNSQSGHWIDHFGIDSSSFKLTTCILNYSIDFMFLQNCVNCLYLLTKSLKFSRLSNANVVFADILKSRSQWNSNEIISFKPTQNHSCKWFCVEELTANTIRSVWNIR